MNDFVKKAALLSLENSGYNVIDILYCPSTSYSDDCVYLKVEYKRNFLYVLCRTHPNDGELMISDFVNHIEVCFCNYDKAKTSSFELSEFILYQCVCKANFDQGGYFIYSRTKKIVFINELSMQYRQPDHFLNDLPGIDLSYFKSFKIYDR